MRESEPRIDPLRDVVDKVLHAIRVLTLGRLALNAGRDPMSGALDGDKIFVFAFGEFVVDFIVPDKIVTPHGAKQYRD